MYSDMMSSGPTLFYPPPPTTEYFPHSRAHCTTYSPSPEPPQMSRHARPPLPQQRSRKRSRDQLDDDERHAALQEENTMDTSAPAPEPIYGEGMILLDPATMRPLGNGASSGTGTWHESQLEEQRRAAEQAVRDEEEMARAINRPTKASRLDMDSIRSGSPTTVAGLVAPTPLTPDTPSAPGYDEAAMALGIGWRKLDATDSALAAATRGWTKYIDNHFTQVSGAEILAKRADGDSFFVKARDTTRACDAWYLFSGSLNEGQLLARNIDTAVRNLRIGSFEGTMMMARVSPEPVSFPSFAQTSLPTEIAMEM